METAAARFAVIELGSRGARLLVVDAGPADEPLQVVRSHGETLDLGRDLADGDGTLPAPALLRARRVVGRYLAQARREGAAAVHLVGTAVFRAARNVDEFRRQLPADLPLQVLAPQDEARCSFYAAGWAFRAVLPSAVPLLVIDGGGGSLEVAWGRLVDDLPRFAGAEVLALGSHALRDRLRDEPGLPAQDVLCQQVRETLLRARLPEWAATAGTAPLAVGMGSAVTEAVWRLRRSGGGGYRSRAVHGVEVGRDELAALRDQVAAGPAGGADENLGAGLVAVVAVLEAVGLARLRACGYGLRYGVALAVAQGLPWRESPAD